MASKTTPQRITTSAATICTLSFTHALRFTMSSTAPIPTMMVAPMSMPMILVSISEKMRMEARKPMNIASPPMRGMGWLCTRRSSLGTSIAPIVSANFFTCGVITSEITNDRAAASTIFSHMAMLGNIFLSPVNIIRRAFPRSPRAYRPCAGSCGRHSSPSARPRCRPAGGMPCRLSCARHSRGWDAGPR